MKLIQLNEKVCQQHQVEREINVSNGIIVLTPCIDLNKLRDIFPVNLLYCIY